ncbi:MAG: ABC transporter substrate-binding protein [Spartobacteria bacterium]|nr:ABC transporter substrate-binding protein [Spartobacteria bacterium]
MALALGMSAFAAKKTVTVASGAVGQELEILKKVSAEYMKDHPDVEIKVWDTPDSASDRLGLYLQFLEAKSDKVDVYQIDVIWPGDLAEHLVDLYQYGARDAVKGHFKAIVENNTVDGKLVAMPWFTDAGLLYYRKDLLEKYGLAVPETWEELTAAAQTIQDGEREAGNPDFVGYVWQGDAYEGLTCDALEWIASYNGGTIVSPDKVITLDNDNAKKAIKMAASWVGTISPAGVIAMQEESARAIWQGGNSAFMRNWPYAYSLGNADNSVIKGKFGVSPLPKGGKDGRHAAALGGWNLAVSKYSADPQVAADVALYLTGAKVQKIRAVEGSYNPTIKALYKDKDVLAASPFFGELYDVFTSAVPRPSTQTAPNYAKVSQAFYQGVYSVLNNEESADAALADVSDDIQEITDYDIKD